MALRSGGNGYRDMLRVRNPNMFNLADIVQDAGTAVDSYGFSPYGPLTDSTQVGGNLVRVDSGAIPVAGVSCGVAYASQGGPIAISPVQDTPTMLAPIAYPMTIDPAIVSEQPCIASPPIQLPPLGGPIIYDSLVGLTLTDQQILEVYDNVKQGTSVADIALAYDISQQQVEDIFTALLNGATTQQILNPTASQFDAVATLPVKSMSATPINTIQPYPYSPLLPSFGLQSFATPGAEVPTDLSNIATSLESGSMNLPVVGNVPTPIILGGGAILLYMLLGRG